MGTGPALRWNRAARWSIASVTLAFCVAASGSVGLPTPPTAGDFRNAKAYVDAHNAVRESVREPKGYSGAWAPLPHLTWSDELAAGAQSWADNLRESMGCRPAHSDVRLGENLAAGKDLGAAQAVALWASERPKFQYASIYVWAPASGHYSQVVWRKTTHLGCGRAMCGKRAIVVCRYSPAGNRIGEDPY